jgi:hypothetical protein
VTRLLDRLEARALLTRAREHTDRRVVTTRITALGPAVSKALDRPVRAAVARMLTHVPPTNLRTLTALLERARATAPAAGRALQRPRAGLHVGQRATRVGRVGQTA